MRYTIRKTYCWGSDLAYLVGLIASDGCLSKDCRHIALVSKDKEIIDHSQKILDAHHKVTTKMGGFQTEAFQLQFSDVALYDFLLAAGLTPAKSKTIPALDVPDAYYPDFLRGYFDGDGTVYGYRDIRWKNSYMYYSAFTGASPSFLDWLRAQNSRLALTTPAVIKPGTRAFSLTYAKRDSRKLFDYMYYSPEVPRLTRKYSKFVDFLATDPYNGLVEARVLELVDRLR